MHPTLPKWGGVRSARVTYPMPIPTHKFTGFPSPGFNPRSSSSSSLASHPPPQLWGRRRRRVDRWVDTPDSPDVVDDQRRRPAEDVLQTRVESPAAAARRFVGWTHGEQVGRAVRLAAGGTGRVRRQAQAVDVPRGCRPRASGSVGTPRSPSAR